MIEVNENHVDLTGDKEIIAAEFICLCVCLLENHSIMYPGHEEVLLKRMLDVALKTYRKFSSKEEK